MKRSKNLTYSKCFCCNKNYNVSKLIEINTNSVIIGEENLTFSFLLLDVTLKKIDETKMNYICEDCKDQLVQFHMFKRDIVKYTNIQEHSNRLEVLWKTDEALNDLNESDLQIYRTTNAIVISRIYEEHLPIEPAPEEIQKEIIEEPNSPEATVVEMLEDEDETMVEIIEEPEMHENENISNVEETEELPNIQIEHSDRRKKYKYKINTNESLTQEQLSWIRDQVRQCEVTINGKRAFKCQMCNKTLALSGTFKKHLRDCHVLKTSEEREERNSKMEFKDEIKRCKMQIQTRSGVETIWKCERCSHNRIFKSEAGFKVHLRYNHIKNQVISADFIAKCKVTVETNQGTKNGWKCVDCQKVVLSRDALRYHMKLEHKDTVATLCEGQQSLEEVQDIQSSNESVISLLEAKRHSMSNVGTLACCESCGIRFVNGTTKKDKSLEIHQQLHIILKIVSHSYELPKCEECKVMFSNNEELNNHLTTHDTNEIYPAEGMSYLVAVKFKDSLGTSESHENSWKCGHCENVHFNDETECIEHQMILHSKQLICPFDYLEFTGIRGLGQFCLHMKNKHLEMFPQLSILCSYCGEEFSNIFDKLTHMKACQTKKYHCDHCQKTFFKKNQLIRHLKIVSGDISFTCELCSKKCVSTMDLKLHLRKHTNEKTYQCNFPNCLKIFKTPAARSSHIEVHSSIEYECTDCKAIFKQRALLQRHLKKACKKNK